MDLRDTLFRIRGVTPLPFLSAGVIWADPHSALIAIGGILCLAGEGLRISALRHAGGATRTRNVGAPELVTSGPYAYVRNPLYLANMLLYSGFALASGALQPYLTIAAILFFAWQYGMIISLEEATLTTLFGEPYARYCSTVPRFLPTLFSFGERRPPRYRPSEALREERSTLTGLTAAWTILVIRFLFFPPLS